jgi:hypothetical protein
MFGHRSFLVLGSEATDITSLTKEGYEILDCNFSFNQGVDNKGRVSTKVYGGTISITLSQLPLQPIIEWGMLSRKYMDGVIVVLDAENLPQEKILFKQGICVDLEISYTQTGESYTETHLLIQAGQLLVGDGIDFENEWINN